jgi:hypothetical protein
MSRLVKPIIYAKEQNISRQAVYAKIKKGLLASKTIDGKIYIILDEEPTTTNTTQNNISSEKSIDLKELLASKEETISILKESIKDLKETNSEINTTLRGEIELLKQVFMEMRSLYVKQLNYMGEQRLITPEKEASLPKPDQPKEESSECWVDLETFLDREKIQKPKKRKKIKNRLLKAYQRSDPRIKRKEDTLFMSCYDFYEDILKRK